MSPSATLATQNEDRCRQVPRLPPKAPRSHRRPNAPPSAQRHACHAKRGWMSPSATPVTRNDGGCRQVPLLPRKVERRHRQTKRAQARHQSQPSATSATPATQNEGGCDQAPHLPRKTKVDVTKRHTCHAKRRWMSPSATPAIQSAAASPATKTGPSVPPEPAQCQKCHACHAKRRWM